MLMCRRARRRIVSLTAFLLCLRGTGQSAHAQDLKLDVRRFEPPTDPDATLALQPTSTVGHGAWSVGIVNSYARRLLVLQDGSGRERAVPIADQLSTDFLFNAGLGERLAFGLRLPMVVRQGGDAFGPLGWQLPRSALGDVALDMKATLIPRGSLGGVGLASIARMTAPTGEANSTISNAGVTGQLHLLGELDWIFAALRMSAGVLVRSERQAPLGDTYGQEMPWAAGIVVKPRALGLDSDGKWQWFVESSGALSLAPKLAGRRTSPAAFGLGARYAFAKDFSGLLGVQLPLDSAMGVPSLRVVIGINWSPRFKDADGDGIADDADDCPEMAEDYDHFEDDDGCPDEDNDGDGISDAQDQCPNMPETVNGVKDNDGCPD
jgi:OmpA-OmpF porin, OOP family